MNLAFLWIQQTSRLNFLISQVAEQICSYNLPSLLTEYEGVALKNIQGNLRFDSVDPIDSNGTQNIRFDLKVKDEEFSNGKLEFEFHPDGMKSLGDLQIKALGGTITLNQIEVGNDISNLQVKDYC